MGNDENEYTALLEALTLEKVLIDPMTPPYQCFAKDPRWWSYYGYPWPVHPRYNKKGLKDIEYVNTDGKRHRLSGPAYISLIHDVEIWYKNGIMHREGGPAYRHKKNLVWFNEGVLHNLHGPAVIEGGGPKQYWIGGQRLSPRQFKIETDRRRRKGLL